MLERLEGERGRENGMEWPIDIIMHCGSICFLKVASQAQKSLTNICRQCHFKNVRISFALKIATSDNQKEDDWAVKLCLFKRRERNRC